MKNKALYQEMNAALEGIGDFTVFDKRKFLAALLTQEIEPERVQGIKDAVRIILACECLDTSDGNLDFGISPKQNDRLMELISEALDPKAA